MVQAVSIRELSLRVAKPGDTGRVLIKELQVGMVNGLVLGVVVFLVVYTMRGDPNLAMVVGGAIPLTILISVALGGTFPLILSSFHIDPAMASGPIITTVVDFVGFFLVLGFAWLALDALK